MRVKHGLKISGHLKDLIVHLGNAARDYTILFEKA